MRLSSQVEPWLFMSNFADSTTRNYRSGLNGFLQGAEAHGLSTSLEELDINQMYAFFLVYSRNLAESTRKRLWTIVKGFLFWVTNQVHPERNPAVPAQQASAQQPQPSRDATSRDLFRAADERVACKTASASSDANVGEEMGGDQPFPGPISYEDGRHRPSTQGNCSLVQLTKTFAAPIPNRAWCARVNGTKQLLLVSGHRSSVTKWGRCNLTVSQRLRGRHSRQTLESQTFPNDMVVPFIITVPDRLPLCGQTPATRYRLGLMEKLPGPFSCATDGVPSVPSSSRLHLGRSGTDLLVLWDIDQHFHKGFPRSGRACSRDVRGPPS